MVHDAARARGAEPALRRCRRRETNLPPPRRTRADLALLLVGVGVPIAPAAVAEASQVGGERTARALVVIGDGALGLHDLALEFPDRLLGLAVPFRRCNLAHGEARGLERLQLSAVLLQLNPVPGDVAVAVRNHVGTPLIRSHSVSRAESAPQRARRRKYGLIAREFRA